MPELSTTKHDVAGKPTPVQLLPPLHRSISIGKNWVFPASDHDIGAREMACECFDPERKSLSVHLRTSLRHTADHSSYATDQEPRRMLYAH